MKKILTITADKQEAINKELENILNEHLMLTQMYSFDGSEKDLRQVAEFSSTCLEHLTNILISNSHFTWSWKAYQKARKEYAEKPTPQTKEKLITHITFNLGVHESSLHTGEKWQLIEDKNGYLKFKPVYLNKFHIRLGMLDDLKKSYPFVEDVIYNQDGLYIQYNEVTNDT
tara:strand:- start:466 stop:981 length:516 start_codon:yes stop_codon:yes gene_type:complete